MSVHFKHFEAYEAKYGSYFQFLKELIGELNPYSEKLGTDFTIISKIPESFQLKLTDFYKKERKLRICIIGQVKAGKSSFLNTLLFNGEKVLPEAATPKTANLTIMEYGEQNQLKVEYYSKNEWEELERLARVDSNVEEIQVAKEIVNLVHTQNINPYDYVGREPLAVDFNNEKDLLGKLNDYAGDNGRYTPVVKYLYLYINNERLKNIQVVDTPGMNDPIGSRTDKTREFMELTDVAFYLSMAEKFLDTEDFNLMIKQLPEKGTKRIIVVASKYDGAIIDTSMELDSLSEAESDIKTRLTRRANHTFQEKIAELESRNPNTKIRKVLEDSLPPLFVSARAHNLASKQIQAYSKDEVKSLNDLNELWDGFTFSHDDLLRIGNMHSVQVKFEDVVKKTDELLIEKAKDLLPDSVEELFGRLTDSESRCIKRIGLLEHGNLEGLKEQQKSILQRKHSIMASVESILGSVNLKMEQKKVEVTSDSRRMMREFMTLPERTGTETKKKYYEVSSAKLFKPWTWFSTEKKSETYYETYQYLDVSDAITNIRHYSHDVSSAIEKIFSQIIDVEGVRRGLTEVIIQNFDGESDGFDPGYFRFLVEKSISSIHFPVITLDINHHLEAITANLTGEVRNASEKSTLLTRLSNTLAGVFDSMEKILLQETDSFKQNIASMKESIIENLIFDIQKEVDILQADIINKSEEIKVYQKMIQILNTKKKELRELFY